MLAALLANLHKRLGGSSDIPSRKREVLMREDEELLEFITVFVTKGDE